MDITLNNIYYNYSDSSSDEVDDIKIRFAKSKLNVILGKSGSGKSTILKTLVGISKPKEGSVKISDIMITKFSSKKDIEKLQCKISYVFQNPEEQFFLDSVEKELLFGMDKKLDKETEFKYYLNAFNLNPKILTKNPRLLSGGEMRKVALISAFLENTETIILDEPTSGLDPESKYKIFNELSNICINKNKTIIVATHEVDVALEYGNHITFVNERQVSLTGSKEYFLSKYKSLNTEFFESPYAEIMRIIEETSGFKQPLYDQSSSNILKPLREAIKKTHISQIK